ncbi:MAG: 3-hydroxyacyl-CoA dehydrogenase/enoyl-CoA hydratase family protein [Gammaproteobacteria bacterium]|nr:MAG: 3-hydroxyacyl-CoA dehydrogenase/enoyl-CoA hydratase family protein [Gammaproteobacteria bacterium]
MSANKDKNGNFIVRKAAVLGAGVMGAQIAAQLVSAGIPTVLFDLQSKEGDPRALVKKAIEGLHKLRPSPLAVSQVADRIQPADYEDDLELLRDCDLIIEAIAERMDWKKDLYLKVGAYVDDGAIFASNTSGLSINELANALPTDSLRSRFCGVHFFNPPRYMHLVELVPNDATDPAILNNLEAFLTTTLGKGVIHAKDTPNFIGNRIGVFSMLATIHHAQAFGLGFDVVDALTGPAIGRPKSATFRTADIVGLDTFDHVVQTMADTLPDDPWHKYFVTPDWLKQLIEKGALGQKTRVGIYKKEGKHIRVLDLKTGEYRPSEASVDDSVAGILREKDPAARFRLLRENDHPQAQFLWAMFRDLFHYSAYQLADIADNARDLDFAIRWGYGWQLGPFETWQASGWAQIAKWIGQDVTAAKAMAAVSLPDWASDPKREGVHTPAGSWAPSIAGYRPRSDLAVYRRQLFPDPLLGEKFDRGTTVFENDEVRLWHQDDDIVILSFKTKMHTVGASVLDGIQNAVQQAEQNFKALVIWHPTPPFSAGADLKGMITLLEAGEIAAVDDMIADFQRATASLKFSMVPTVAAIQGLTLGGGCEIAMHTTKTVAALETYIGLVEAGVGLLPAGGGLKELALRAWLEAKGGDVFPFLRRYFETVAMGKMAGSALEAKEYGFLRPTDTVIFNAFELLYVAKAEASALADSAYRPPLPTENIEVVGATGIANLRMMMVNMLAGHFISEHDYEVGSRIAAVLCGGELDHDSHVDENWLLRLERDNFSALAQMPKTQERIMHTLKTGKPLRN